MTSQVLQKPLALNCTVSTAAPAIHIEETVYDFLEQSAFVRRLEAAEHLSQTTRLPLYHQSSSFESLGKQELRRLGFAFEERVASLALTVEFLQNRWRPAQTLEETRFGNVLLERDEALYFHGPVPTYAPGVADLGLMGRLPKDTTKILLNYLRRMQTRAQFVLREARGIETATKLPPDLVGPAFTMFAAQLSVPPNIFSPHVATEIHKESTVVWNISHRIFRILRIADTDWVLQGEPTIASMFQLERPHILRHKMLMGYDPVTRETTYRPVRNFLEYMALLRHKRIVEVLAEDNSMPFHTYPFELPTFGKNLEKNFGEALRRSRAAAKYLVHFLERNVHPTSPLEQTRYGIRLLQQAEHLLRNGPVQTYLPPALALIEAQHVHSKEAHAMLQIIHAAEIAERDVLVEGMSLFGECQKMVGRGARVGFRTAWSLFRANPYDVPDMEKALENLLPPRTSEVATRFTKALQRTKLGLGFFMSAAAGVVAIGALFATNSLASSSQTG